MDATASALAVYRIAHRYCLAELQRLALAHIVETLTVRPTSPLQSILLPFELTPFLLQPRTAFPLLLSTRLYPELHSAVKQFALANFVDVCAEPEFARCYAEVGEGLWDQGGAILLDFTLELTPA